MRKGYFDLKRPEILALIPRRAKKVLDLGCGAGTLGKTLKERQPCHITGIELYKEAVEIAEALLNDAQRDNDQGSVWDYKRIIKQLKTRRRAKISYVIE